MKLLAVFGLALAVVAVDKTASNGSLFGLLKATTKEPVSGLKALSEVSGCKVSVAVDPKMVIPLVRYCLEAGESLLPENLLGMSVARIAAFIFMFRVQGYEETAEWLYNFAMKKHFSVQFAARLHEKSYPQDPLLEFGRFMARPLEGFGCLKTKQERQLFFMLWTVQMYGRRQNGESGYAHRARLFKFSDAVMLILVRMEFSPEVLFAGIFQLQKARPAGITPSSLSGLQLALFSFTKDEYLGLKVPERAQLHAFLKRYVECMEKNSELFMEKLSRGKREQLEQLEQFREVFELEGLCKCESLQWDTVAKFANCFYRLAQAEYPAFLVQKRFDFCLRVPFFTMEEILDKRHYLLMALIEALRMAKKNRLVCDQIERTISRCNSKIGTLLANFANENPEGKEKWEKTSHARGLWAAFKEKRKEACAYLKLLN